MSRQALGEYISGLWELYKAATKRQKTDLLNQAEKISGKSRRSVQRYLAQCEVAKPGFQVQISGRGRKPIYPPDKLLPHIRVLWRAMEMISSERMIEALPKWLPHYQSPTFTPEVKDLLLEMSRCTLERFLVQIRGESQAKRGISTTSSALRAFKNKIPINTLAFKRKRFGIHRRKFCRNDE